MTRVPAQAATALRIGAWLSVAGGLLSGALAFVPFDTDAAARPVPPGQPVALPSPGFFGNRSLVLYAVIDGPRPRPADLGCTVRDDEQRALPAKVSSLRALGAGTRRVEGTEVTPVATVRGFRAGWKLTCGGPAIGSMQPAYLMADERRPVPTGPAAAFAVVAVAFGTASLLVLRTRPVSPSSRR